MATLRSANRLCPYLAGGWAFFVPYALLYLVGFLLHLTAEQLRWSFWVCHVLLVASAIVGVLLAGLSFASSRRAVPWAGIAFWLLLLALFWVPGAYLEFPADPWEHVRRLNSWRPEGPLMSSPWASRFAYFWGWSFLSVVSPGRQRALLDALSGFWQTLLAWQLFLFARRLGFSKGWARIQVLTAVACFGNSIFGFFRYYALSATPLAYVAYLRAARAVLDLVERRGSTRRSALVLGSSLVLVALNHTQELLFFVVSTGAIVGWSALRRLDEPRRRGALFVMGYLFLVALVGGRIVMLAFENRSAPHPWFSYPFVSDWATFRIWDPAHAYFRTLGAPGVLALALAVVGFRLHPLVATLTLVPTLLLSFPPFALLFAYATPQPNTYRLLYLLPPTFMAVAAIRAAAEVLWPRRAAVGQSLAVALALVAGLAAQPPFFGKLRLQVYRPGPVQAVTHVDSAAEWFARNRRLDARCMVTSDPVTESVLGALLGREVSVERTSGARWIGPEYFDVWRPAGPQDFLAYFNTHAVCGFLVLREPVRPLSASRGSWVGAVSGHWPKDASDLGTRVPPDWIRSAEGLLGLGWRRTAVPPFYWYYEPP